MTAQATKLLSFTLPDCSAPPARVSVYDMYHVWHQIRRINRWFHCLTHNIPATWGDRHWSHFDSAGRWTRTCLPINYRHNWNARSNTLPSIQFGCSLLMKLATIYYLPLISLITLLVFNHKKLRVGFQEKNPAGFHICNVMDVLKNMFPEMC